MLQARESGLGLDGGFSDCRMKKRGSIEEARRGCGGLGTVMPLSPPPLTSLTLTSWPVSASERIGAQKLGWAERGHGGAGGRGKAMHWQRDRLHGDEAGAFVDHSLGAPPGPGRGGGQGSAMISYLKYGMRGSEIIK